MARTPVLWKPPWPECSQQDVGSFATNCPLRLLRPQLDCLQVWVDENHLTNALFPSVYQKPLAENKRVGKGPARGYWAGPFLNYSLIRSKSHAPRLVCCRLPGGLFSNFSFMQLQCSSPPNDVLKHSPRNSFPVLLCVFVVFFFCINWYLQRPD